jgi:hypothetical protein
MANGNKQKTNSDLQNITQKIEDSIILSGIALVVAEVALPDKASYTTSYARHHKAH